jgi:acyl-CoA hydrolase
MSTESTRTVSSTRVEMAQIMEPGDANFLGKVFGGSIMSLIDLCAYATASKFAGTICVTASIDRIDFHDPINVGELVSMVGTVTFVGRTSVEVTIEIYAENLMESLRRHTNTARVTMVALKDGKPTGVPRLIPETREEKARFLAGRLRREMRSKQTEDLERIIKEYTESSEEELDRLLCSNQLQ